MGPTFCQDLVFSMNVFYPSLSLWTSRKCTGRWLWFEYGFSPLMQMLLQRWKFALVFRGESFRKLLCLNKSSRWKTYDFKWRRRRRRLTHMCAEVLSCSLQSQNSSLKAVTRWDPIHTAKCETKGANKYFLKKGFNYFNFIWMCVHASLCVHHVPMEDRRRCWSLGTGASGNCELPDMVLEAESGPLPVQQAPEKVLNQLFNPESFHSTAIFFFCLFCF